MRRTAVLCDLIILALGISLTADTYIKQVTHENSYVLMGEKHEEREEIIETWIDKNKMAVHGQAQSLLFLLDKDVIYFIDHGQKSYVEMRVPVDLRAYFPEQYLQLMENVTVNVSATGESQKFEKRECGVYAVTIGSLMMSIKMRVWATTDVPFDWKAYRDKMFPELIKVTLRLPDSAVSEMTKIDGFPFRSEIVLDFMGTEMKSEQNVLEISRKPAPEGIYSLPPDYTKKERLSLQDLRF